jgi:hypothetical protein
MDFGKIKQKPSILQVSIILVFIGLVFLAAYLFLKTKRTETVIKGSSDVQKKENQEDLVWVNYQNNEFKFSFDRPKFLQKNELEDAGNYSSFIRFEETQFSRAKGLAVGVRENSLENEVEQLKLELEKDFDIRLISESKILIDGYDAIRLKYEPKNKSEFESRDFIVINNGKFSFSISTVPEQIDRVISSFKFL